MAGLCLDGGCHRPQVVEVLIQYINLCNIGIEYIDVSPFRHISNSVVHKILSDIILIYLELDVLGP